MVYDDDDDKILKINEMGIGTNGGAGSEWDKERDSGVGRGQGPASGVHVVDWGRLHGPQSEPRCCR